MLRVITSQEAEALLREHFAGYTSEEEIPLGAELGRTLFANVISRECVPDFNRSMVVAMLSMQRIHSAARLAVCLKLR